MVRERPNWKKANEESHNEAFWAASDERKDEVSGVPEATHKGGNHGCGRRDTGRGPRRDEEDYTSSQNTLTLSTVLGRRAKRITQ